MSVTDAADWGAVYIGSGHERQTLMRYEKKLGSHKSQAPSWRVAPHVRRDADRTDYDGKLLCPSSN